MTYKNDLLPYLKTPRSIKQLATILSISKYRATQCIKQLHKAGKVKRVQEPRGNWPALWHGMAGGGEK